MPYIKSNNMKRALILLCLQTFLLFQLSADIIRGRVVDAISLEGVPYAELTCLLVLDAHSGLVMQKHMADSVGRFNFFSMGNGKIVANMVGYKGGVLASFNAFSESRRDTVDVGDIKLQPSQTLMKMLEVNARARRFTVSGDTIVFNPEAFHLEEGARLMELIPQLPGVTVDGDELRWNGRPMRVIMEGNDLFGGSALIKQLPVDAVENIKAYNKASEFSERTGKDDGKEDMVLDLKIKPGFLDKFYGDATARYQPTKRFEGEVAANRLSEKNPLMIYGEANNMNRHMGKTFDSWKSWANDEGFGLGQFGAIGYQHNWGRHQGGHSLRSYSEINGSLSHDDQWGRDYQETLNYFTDNPGSHISEQTRHSSHELKPRLNSTNRWEIDTLNTIYANVSAEYGRQESHNEGQIRQFALTESLSHPMDTMALMAGRTHSRAFGDDFNLRATAGWTHYIKEGSIGIDAEWNTTYGKKRGENMREYSYPSDAAKDYELHQETRLNLNSNYGSIRVEAKRWMTPKVLLSANYTFKKSKTRDSQDFFTDGIFDAKETYSDTHDKTSHILSVSSSFNLRPFLLIPTLTYTAFGEQEAYRRGALDTIADRRRHRLEPSMTAKWKINPTSELNLNYGFLTWEPELRNTIAYRDATDPVFIVEGNPSLANVHVNRGALSYRTTIPSCQLQLSADAGIHITDRAHQQMLYYDSNRASYLSKAENVEGELSLYMRMNYDQGFGDIFRLNNILAFHQRRNYAFLAQTDMTEPLRMNCQHRSEWQDDLRFSMDWKWLKANLFTNIRAQRLSNSSSLIQNTTLWQNRFGAEAELRKGKFTVKTELYDLMRRGYVSKEMNKDRLIWNASASWRCLKGKGKVSIELNDILNNSDNFTSVESANQQVMSWSDQLHHYLCLGFTYHFDAKKK